MTTDQVTRRGVSPVPVDIMDKCKWPDTIKMMMNGDAGIMKMLR